MPKNIVEDIITPSGRKSIRDIPIPEARRKKALKKKDSPEPAAPREKEPEIQTALRKKAVPMRRTRRRGKSLWISIALGAAVVLVVAMILTAGGTLSYTPKHVALSFDGDQYQAEKSDAGGLLYSVVKLSGDKGVAVPATGEEHVERKASGTIVIYNNNTSAQRLVENTRFETPDGKIYRIASPVTVSARRTVSGTAQPGTLEATAYADEPGESYNMGLADFTLPGLEGTASFSTVYARSKTPMAGGFVGVSKSVSPENVAQSKAQLEAELRAELLSEAQTQVPDDFILFPSLSVVTFEDLAQTPSEGGGNSVTINIRGNLYGVMFKRSDLSKHLASSKTELSTQDSVVLENLKSLNISFSGAEPADMLGSDSISFTVTGEARLVWMTDEEVLKKDLLGRHKDDVPSILNNYPSIAEANASTRPFWKSSFPEDVKEISIKKLPIKK